MPNQNETDHTRRLDEATWLLNNATPDEVIGICVGPDTPDGMRVFAQSNESYVTARLLDGHVFDLTYHESLDWAIAEHMKHLADAR